MNIYIHSYDNPGVQVLNRALRACEKEGYECGLEDTCRQLAYRLKRIDEEVRLASDSLDEKAVRVTRNNPNNPNNNPNNPE